MNVYNIRMLVSALAEIERYTSRSTFKNRNSTMRLAMALEREGIKVWLVYSRVYEYSQPMA